ncbi:hypothetical protein BD310DRAFT_434550 [Dichomitus squalens]|uniref:Uncharacterized protein n=1 Tax=Dichomitus squalens TaxID=114155 RepID=A0A4Q9PWF4_9APHY|nr:hypothetical protein BD310DRAFT_434550 [Dichomitus squalens]
MSTTCSEDGTSNWTSVVATRAVIGRVCRRLIRCIGVRIWCPGYASLDLSRKSTYQLLWLKVTYVSLATCSYLRQVRSLPAYITAFTPHLPFRLHCVTGQNELERSCCVQPLECQHLAAMMQVPSPRSARKVRFNGLHEKSCRRGRAGSLIQNVLGA